MAAEPEIPPWVDDGPPPEGEAEPRHAPLRAPAPAAITVPAPRAAMLDAPPVTTELGDRWAAVVMRLAAQGRIGALVRELAWQAGVREHASGADSDCWTLVVERESLRSGSTPDKLAAALGAELGRPQQLVLEAGVPADSVARREAWERQRRQAEAEQAIRDDPAVQELLSQFKTARIVPGSIRPA